jgi:hypothetical protein
MVSLESVRNQAKRNKATFSVLLRYSNTVKQHMFRRPACLVVASMVLTATLLPVTVSSGCPVSASESWEPIEIVSVLGPVGPVNPGGPGVEITLKNLSVEPVISLTANLEVETAFGTSIHFTFDDVSPSNPLQPNASATGRRFLIGAGFSSDVSYPLTINATMRNGANFIYTKLVQIVRPQPNIWRLVLVGAICALFPPYVAVLGIPAIIVLYLSISSLWTLLVR